jgi:hypothetical protein
MNLCSFLSEYPDQHPPHRPVAVAGIQSGIFRAMPPWRAKLNPAKHARASCSRRQAKRHANRPRRSLAHDKHARTTRSTGTMPDSERSRSHHTRAEHTANSDVLRGAKISIAGEAARRARPDILLQSLLLSARWQQLLHPPKRNLLSPRPLDGGWTPRPATRPELCPRRCWPGNSMPRKVSGGSAGSDGNGILY